MAEIGNCARWWDKSSDMRFCILESELSWYYYSMLCFSRHDLTKHNANVHKQDPRPYRCEHCGRQFSTSAYLSQHRRIHLGVKPYACRFCDRRFTQLSHVQQHERIHTGQKPYKCCTCFKCFTQMSNLQSHQRQHMKGKPYRCEHCFMCFDVQEELDTHIQAKHAGHKYSKILVCPICSKNYNSETYLNKHILKHKESAAAAAVSAVMDGNYRSHYQHPLIKDQLPPPAHQGLKMKTEHGSCSPRPASCMEAILGISNASLTNTGPNPGSLISPSGAMNSNANNSPNNNNNNNNNNIGHKERNTAAMLRDDFFFNRSMNGHMNARSTPGLPNSSLNNPSSLSGSMTSPNMSANLSRDKMSASFVSSRSNGAGSVDPFCMQYGGGGNHQRLPTGFNPAAVAYSALMDHHSTGGVGGRDAPYDMIPSFTFPNFRF